MLYYFQRFFSPKLTSCMPENRFVNVFFLPQSLFPLFCDFHRRLYFHAKRTLVGLRGLVFMTLEACKPGNIQISVWSIFRPGLENGWRSGDADHLHMHKKPGSCVVPNASERSRNRGLSWEFVSEIDRLRMFLICMAVVLIFSRDADSLTCGDGKRTREQCQVMT